MPLALVISHGHPAFSVGGAEVASYNLYRGLQERLHIAQVPPPPTASALAG